MSFFQKLNVFLEEIKLYPMFTELSIHLGNVQTLLTQNKLLTYNKKYLTCDDEILFSDLILNEIPQFNEEELKELKKCLLNIQPKLFDYFNIVKSIWTLVFDSLTINVKRNKKNIKLYNGFFYNVRENIIRVWRYETKKISDLPLQTKTNVKLIYEGEENDLTIVQLISKFSEGYKKQKQKNYPIFEVLSTQNFPIEETIVPIAKRKIVSLTNQLIRVEKLQKEQKMITNNV